jgi:hypothetical protein
MSAPDSVKVGTVKAGETKNVSVPMKAPDKDANIKATWRLMDDKGNLFGEQMTVLIVAGQPAAAAAAAVPNTSAPVTGGPFELGGQVNCFPTVPERMHYAGMNWVKIQVGKGCGVPIAEMHNLGFKILISAVSADHSRANDPAFQDAFAAELAGYAAQGADAIEVWNEMNIDAEWPPGQIDAASYIQMLKKAYTAIKARNPNTLVISGAPSPTGYFGGGCASSGCDDAPYIAAMFANGAANYMDCIGIHYNEGILPPSQTSGDPRGSSGHYTRYFWGMVNAYWNASGGARKLCFTELGYLSPEGYGTLPSRFGWAQNTTVAQQAQWLAEAASLAANSGKVRLMIVWNVDFSGGGDDPMGGYAMIRPGGGCPACESLHGVMGNR